MVQAPGLFTGADHIRCEATVYEGVVIHSDWAATKQVI